MNLRNLTPFLMLDHFHISNGAVSNILSFPYLSLTRNRTLQGFPDHPHRGQVTVTYMLEG